MADIKDAANDAVAKLSDSVEKMMKAADKLTASAESLSASLPMGNRKKERGWRRPFFGMLILAGVAAVAMFGRNMIMDMLGQLMGGGEKRTGGTGYSPSSAYGSGSGSDPFPRETPANYPR